MTSLQPLIDQLCAPGKIANPQALSDQVKNALADYRINHFGSNLLESLDDQKAIMPEGWEWHDINQERLGWWRARLGRGKHILPSYAVGKAPTEERARLAAILKAVSYENQRN